MRRPKWGVPDRASHISFAAPCGVIPHPSSFVLMHARVVLAPLLFVFFLAPPPSMAQAYPPRPLRLIVGFVPGGAADLLARALGQKLTEAWGQQVIVDNRAGAGGSISMQLTAKAVPDGYTLLLGS